MVKNIFYLLVCLLPMQLIAQQEIPLWSAGAPGFENRRNEPIQAKDWWVKNIHNPSITVYLPPPEKATGAAVIVCPGGGHRELVFNAEGVEAAAYLNSIGVAAFVLKYRLSKEEGSPYTLEKHVREDAYRAMRLVRSRSQEWKVDPTRIGMLGFSAGGEVVALVAYAPGEGDPKAADPIDRLNGRPNFQMLVYPGQSGIPDVVPSDAPPAFLLVANDDVGCSIAVMKIIQKYREANVPVEAHILAQGKHAFNMGNRSKLNSIKTWPQRMGDWMSDTNLLSPWIVLFDGKSVESLRGYKMDKFPDKAWKIEDGALVALTGVPNVDFVTKESYKDFELTFEWKVSKAANSGVYYHMQEVATHEAGNGNSPNWLDNFELQILDDIDFKDKEPKRSAGSLYDLMAPQNKKLKPVGEYNEMKLIVNHGHVGHWLNGTKILEYEAGSESLNKLIGESKFKDNPDFAKSTDGLIMFQHHGQMVWFRNIRIRRL